MRSGVDETLEQSPRPRAGWAVSFASAGVVVAMLGTSYWLLDMRWIGEVFGLLRGGR